MYQRVIPRDLFNEAKLLKSMGQLALLIHDGMGGKWGLHIEHITDEREEAGFVIEQNENTGGLYVNNLCLQVGEGGDEITLESAYNSKLAYPLIVCDQDTVCNVFNDNGAFSDEFVAYLDSRVAS